MEKLGIKFTPVEEFLINDPSEVIDKLIRHLELMKNDIEDKTYKESSLLSSLSIRFSGYKGLDELLRMFLKQHNIK